MHINLHSEFVYFLINNQGMSDFYNNYTYLMNIVLTLSNAAKQ